MLPPKRKQAVDAGSLAFLAFHTRHGVNVHKTDQPRPQGDQHHREHSQRHISRRRDQYEPGRHNNDADA